MRDEEYESARADEAHRRYKMRRHSAFRNSSAGDGYPPGTTVGDVEDQEGVGDEGLECTQCNENIGYDDTGNEDACIALGIEFPAHLECLQEFVKENPKFLNLVIHLPGFD